MPEDTDSIAFPPKVNRDKRLPPYPEFTSLGTGYYFVVAWQLPLADWLTS